MTSSITPGMPWKKSSHLSSMCMISTEEYVCSRPRYGSYRQSRNQLVGYRGSHSAKSRIGHYVKPSITSDFKKVSNWLIFWDYSIYVASAFTRSLHMVSKSLRRLVMQTGELHEMDLMRTSRTQEERVCNNQSHTGNMNNPHKVDRL